MPENTNEEKETTKINLKHIVLILMVFVLIVIAYICTCKNKVKELEKELGEPEEVTPITAFNQEEAIKLLKQYLSERSIAKSNPQAFLERCGLATNAEITSFEKTSDKKYLKSNILYEDIKNQLSNYITPTFFRDEYKEIFQNSNGMTHIAIISAEPEEYKITRFQSVESTTNKETMSVWYTITKEGETSLEQNMKVEFTKTNGVWLISNIK